MIFDFREHIHTHTKNLTSFFFFPSFLTFSFINFKNLFISTTFFLSLYSNELSVPVKTVVNMQTPESIMSRNSSLCCVDRQFETTALPLTCILITADQSAWSPSTTPLLIFKCHYSLSEILMHEYGAYSRLWLMHPQKQGDTAGPILRKVGFLSRLRGGVPQIHYSHTLRAGFQGISTLRARKISMTVKSKSSCLMHS